MEGLRAMIKFLRIKLHVARYCHFLFALVDLLDAFLEISPYLLQVDVLQASVAAEAWWSVCCHDDDPLRRFSYFVRSVFCSDSDNLRFHSLFLYFAFQANDDERGDEKFLLFCVRDD